MKKLTLIALVLLSVRAFSQIEPISPIPNTTPQKGVIQYAELVADRKQDNDRYDLRFNKDGNSKAMTPYIDSPINALNALGKDGWHLVCVFIYVNEGGGYERHYELEKE